jgi:hypothetical protein
VQNVNNTSLSREQKNVTNDMKTEAEAEAEAEVEADGEVVVEVEVENVGGGGDDDDDDDDHDDNNDDDHDEEFEHKDNKEAQQPQPQNSSAVVAVAPENKSQPQPQQPQQPQQQPPSSSSRSGPQILANLIQENKDRYLRVGSQAVRQLYRDSRGPITRIDSIDYLAKVLASFLQDRDENVTGWSEYLEIVDRMLFFIFMNVMDNEEKTEICEAVQNHALLFAHTHELVPHASDLTNEMKEELITAIRRATDFSRQVHQLARRWNQSNQSGLFNILQSMSHILNPE